MGHKAIVVNDTYSFGFVLVKACSPSVMTAESMMEIWRHPDCGANWCLSKGKMCLQLHEQHDALKKAKCIIISPGAEQKQESTCRGADVNYWLSRDIDKFHFGAEIHWLLWKIEQDFLHWMFMLEVTKRRVRKKMWVRSQVTQHTSANATKSLMRVFVMTRADTDLQIPYQ